MELNVNLSQVRWDDTTQTFSAYLSDLGWGALGNLCATHQSIWIWNPKTGNKVKIYWYADDKDGSGEDTYGYKYRGRNPRNNRTFEFLFINT
jgi:hypothetical protein